MLIARLAMHLIFLQCSLLTKNLTQHAMEPLLKNFALPKKAFSLTLAVLAALVLIAINEIGFHKSTAAVLSIEEAQKSRNALNTMMQLMLNAETGQRGYLLTGEARYLKPYSAATAEIGQQLTTLRQLLAPHEDQTLQLEPLARHISSKLAEMDLSVRMRTEGNDDAWKFVLTTDVGQQHMEIIRTQTEILAANSARKTELAQVQIQKTLQLSRIAVALIALAGLVAFYLYLKQTRALFKSGLREKESLQRERDQLDLQVRERTANLAELATHLQNVREDERGHLARELHDELGALLTAAKLDVARIKSRLGNAMPEASERLSHLTDTLNSGIALKRRIVEDLRPSSLSHLGLVASLEILAREFEDRAGLAVITDLESVELSGSAQLTVYRLVQEALTNIGKYAEATQAVISVQNTEGFVAIEVHDNGKGFDVASVGPGSHGLSGMRHRVEAAGGRLSISAQLGLGTHISALLPKAA